MQQDGALHITTILQYSIFIHRAYSILLHQNQDTTMAGFRIAIGGDDAGFAYKSTIVEDLNKDPRVSTVVDTGPCSAQDKTPYANSALAAAKLVASGEVDRAGE